LLFHVVLNFNDVKTESFILHFGAPPLFLQIIVPLLEGSASYTGPSFL